MSDTLASIIPPELYGQRVRAYDQWSSTRLHDHLPMARLHAKFWGKSTGDEQRLAKGSTPGADGDDVPGEDESMCVDGNSITDKDEDEEVLPGCHTIDIGIDDLMIRKFWIRADYIRIYEYLEDFYTRVVELKRGAPAAVVTGQPGIGKSVWIYYALLRRLSERKSVIWYYNGDCYLFVEEGVYKLPPEFQTAPFRPYVWTLVDADESPDCVPSHLVDHGTHLYVIYLTSPIEDRWSRLHKTTRRTVLIMNPWTKKEIFRAAQLLLPPTIERDRIEELFDHLSPTPRICIDYVENVEKLDKYNREVDEAISSITALKLKSMVRDASAMRMNEASDKLLLISRQELNDVFSAIVVAPITYSIKMRLAIQFRHLDSDELARLSHYYGRPRGA